MSIAGGVGSTLGLFRAVLILGLLAFGMPLNNIPGQVVSLYIGALVVAVIAIPRIIERMKCMSGQQRLAGKLLIKQDAFA